MSEPRAAGAGFPRGERPEDDAPVPLERAMALAPASEAEAPGA